MSDLERMARVEQRLDDFGRTMEAFAPTVTMAATLNVQIQHLDDGLKGLHADVKELREALDTRDAQMTKDRRDTRVALWSLVGVLGAALISGGAAIVVALVGGG